MLPFVCPSYIPRDESPQKKHGYGYSAPQMNIRSQSQPVLESLRPGRQIQPSGHVASQDPAATLDPAALQHQHVFASASCQSLPAVSSLSLYSTDESHLSKEEAWIKLQKEMGSLSNAVTGQVSKAHMRLKLPSAGIVQSPKVTRKWSTSSSHVSSANSIAGGGDMPVMRTNSYSAAGIMARRRTR
jgi:hypothetical protein